MKKTLFSNFLLLFIVSTVYLPNTFAEDATQWHLPEDVKARLGKSKINEQYSIRRMVELLAVASGIGIWIYDTTTYQEVSPTCQRIRVGVGSLAFSPDGRTFVSGSEDGTILPDGLSSWIKA